MVGSSETKNGLSEPEVVTLDPNAISPALDAVLRKMNHREWLQQFASVLNMRSADGSSPPMTPFRAGAMTRLKFAALYIDLLERELRDAMREIAAVKHDAAREIELLQQHIVELQRDDVVGDR